MAAGFRTPLPSFQKIRILHQGQSCGKLPDFHLAKDSHGQAAYFNGLLTIRGEIVWFKINFEQVRMEVRSRDDEAASMRCG